MSTIMAFSARFFSDAANSRRGPGLLRTSGRGRSCLSWGARRSAGRRVRRTTRAMPSRWRSRASRRKRHTAAAGRQRGPRKGPTDRDGRLLQAERVVHLVRFARGDGLAEPGDDGGIFVRRDRRLPRVSDVGIALRGVLAIVPWNATSAFPTGGIAMAARSFPRRETARTTERKPRGFADGQGAIEGRGRLVADEAGGMKSLRFDQAAPPAAGSPSPRRDGRSRRSRRGGRTIARPRPDAS